MEDMRTTREADIASDHHPVVAMIKRKLKKHWTAVKQHQNQNIQYERRDSHNIGLAVGDIDKARRSAAQELIYRQVYWLDSLEANLPRWLYAKVCVQKWLLKPARPNLPRTEYNLQKIGMVQLSIASNHAKAINTNNGNTIGYWKLR
ncbi:unnamed protein product [Schistosoma mattheei]|uniref:Uncharacterized protein n=1 Tax=Schistosoma mattheei TaxID=31246 RepID=A0A183PKC9_9TREM|nr:unnamed protein product [Schistosoma mattheei]